MNELLRAKKYSKIDVLHFTRANIIAYYFDNDWALRRILPLSFEGKLLV